MSIKPRTLCYLFCSVVIHLSLLGCASAPKQSVTLSEVTETQVIELQKSHIQFVQLYYKKLREDIDTFMNNKWIPLFLAKVVQNDQFRKDLDDAYVTANIHGSDIQVLWKGQPLVKPQMSTVRSGIEQAVSDERGRLGRVLLDFSQEAQQQINKKRQSLLQPIQEQERMIIDEINAAYADLQRAQATLKAYLESVVELKEQQQRLQKKLGVLERSEQIVNTAIGANEKLSAILQHTDNADQAIESFLEEVEKIKKSFESILPGSMPTTVGPSKS